MVSELGCDVDDVGRLHELLFDWRTTWKVRGAPIGPEASGILGDAMLYPLGRALREMGVGFVRYADDVHLLLRREHRWEAGLARVRTLFDAEVERPEPSARRIRHALRVFTNHGDPHGVRVVAQYGWLRRLAPSHVGRYVAKMHAQGGIDRDWLTEQATGNPPAASVAGQYHLLLALREGRHRLPRAVGDRLQAMTSSMSHQVVGFELSPRVCSIVLA